MKKLIACLGVAMIASFALGQVNVWNPAANGIVPPAEGYWNTPANWTGSVLPAGKAVFNVANAATCILNDTQSIANELVMGDNGPGGTLVLASGANLTVNSWAATSYNDGGTMIVQDGAVANFNVHLFLGMRADGATSGFTSEFIMEGGTVNIGDALLTGLNYGTTGGVYGEETLHIQLDGGIVTAGRMELDWGTCDITDGTLVTRRNDLGYLQQFIDNGRLTGYGDSANIRMDYDAGLDQTTVYAVPEPATAGLLGFVGGGLLWFRKRFAI